MYVRTTYEYYLERPYFDSFQRSELRCSCRNQRPAVLRCSKTWESVLNPSRYDYLSILLRNCAEAAGGQKSCRMPPCTSSTCGQTAGRIRELGTRLVRCCSDINGWRTSGSTRWGKNSCARALSTKHLLETSLLFDTILN